MDRTVIQIPVNINLRNKAEEAASSYGFSSLQELIRVFLTKLSQKTIEVTFVEKEKYLTQKTERRYLKMLAEAKKGINWYQAEDPKDFIIQLKKGQSNIV